MFQTPLVFSNVSAFSARSAVKLGGIVISLEKSIVPLRGSHIVMSKGNVILVIPNHETVAKGTERDLIKDAGLTVEEFNKLLKK